MDSPLFIYTDEVLSFTVSGWLSHLLHSWWLLVPLAMLLVVAAFIVAFVLLLYMVSPLISPKPLKLNGAHVVVTRQTVMCFSHACSIVTMGLFRTIALFYLGSFDSIVRRCMMKREQLKTAEKSE
uniref:Uncharacterized protein n=1 Tax=Erpetoichthys calabaricus TaxID=27687 RepID=A0A8C4RXN9_ERPCA